MKRLFVCFALLIIAVSAASAQTKKELSEMRRDAIREAKLEAKNAAQNFTGPTAGDVGDPDSFGKNAVFLGVASSGAIFVEPSCAPADLAGDGITLGPDDRCLEVSNPAATTTATFTDIGRITIPGKSVSNIIYTLNNHTISWRFENPNAGNVLGRFTYSPLITIESDALNDPAAIDPNTGLPMNGQFTTGGNGTRSITHLLFPNASETDTQSYTRANTLGFSRAFFAALGLPQNVINNLYKKPITIRLGATVTARNVTFGLMTYSARFLGN